MLWATWVLAVKFSFNFWEHGLTGGHDSWHIDSLSKVSLYCLPIPGTLFLNINEAQNFNADGVS